MSSDNTLPFPEEGRQTVPRRRLDTNIAKDGLKGKREFGNSASRAAMTRPFEGSHPLQRGLPRQHGNREAGAVTEL